MSNKTQALLIQARALIKSGWCRFAWAKERKNGEFSYCIVGALQSATRTLETPQSLVSELLRVLPKSESIYTGSLRLIEWNDQRGRKKAEVLALFNRAIEKAGQ